jgi:hypothetical protein
MRNYSNIELLYIIIGLHYDCALLQNYYAVLSDRMLIIGFPLLSFGFPCFSVFF